MRALKTVLPILLAVAFAQLAAPQAPTIGSGSCTVFPADNIWNARVDQLPVSSNSATWVNTIGTSAHLHPDFGSGTYNGEPIGIPYVTVPGTQTKYPATFTYQSESDPGPYAIPLNAPIEGGSSSTGDRHVISIDTDNCILYEIYDGYPQSASWQGGSGAIYNLSSDALRPAGWTSADAAGLPIFPGLVRYDEVSTGVIRHAIRFTVPQTQDTYVWPGRHEASSLTGSQYPPMGARFRLKASFDISSYSAANQVILTALKQYGMLLADNGSSWYISGAPDANWNNDDLHLLNNIAGSNFEAVDVSSLMVNANSGQTRQTASGPSPVSVSPNSGSGSSQTFAFNFSDPNGTSDIVSAQIDIGSQLASISSCYFYYAAASNKIYLASDAGAWQGPLTLGTAGTLTNTQCAINAASSSKSVSGNTLTVNLAISFTAPYDGAKKIFMEVANASQASAWSQMGTWTVNTAAPPAPDFSVGISPSTTSVTAGGSGTYSVTVTPLNGFTGVVSFGASGLPSGVTATFNPPTITGSGSTTLTLSTSAGTPAGTSTVTVTGTSSPLTHNTTASLAVSAAASGPPTAVSVSPSSGSGNSQTFAFTFSDPNGASDIVSAQIVINAQLASVNSCYFYYSRASNGLYLASDAGAWQGPVAIAATGTLSNSQCSVNTASSSTSASGTTLTLNLAVTFQSSFAGAKSVFAEVHGAAGDSGWTKLGTWTATAGGGTSGGPPAASSVSPSSGSGMSQTFAFTFTDPNGATDIVSAQMDINSQLASTSACYFYYSRASNSIYLAGNTGAWQGPMTLGSTGTLSNSQCSLNAATSSSSSSGMTLTVNLALTFNASFAGAKGVFLEVHSATQDSGWSKLGAWTVP